MSIKQSLLLATALLLPLGAAAEPGAPAPSAATASPFIVYCYDQRRDVVMRDLASHCQGTVVSEAEARTIQERRSRAVTQGLASHPNPAPERTRLASIGTAFFIDDSGRLLTNNHVVSGCTAVVIEPPEGEALPAKVLALDSQRDLALLQVPGKPLAVAPLRSQMLEEPGAFVAAVGYPDQGMPPREPIVTSGVLENPPHGVSWGERLVIKGDIEPGNSGSPVVEQHGLVIGLMNAKVNTVAIYSKTGELVTGIGVGIPLPIMLDFLKANGVTYSFAQQGNPLDTEQILKAARAYVARAECWK